MRGGTPRLAHACTLQFAEPSLNRDLSVEGARDEVRAAAAGARLAASRANVRAASDG